MKTTTDMNSFYFASAEDNYDKKKTAACTCRTTMHYTSEVRQEEKQECRRAEKSYLDDGE